MRRPFRHSELFLTLLFLVIIFAVPVVQTALEFYSQENIQFTDVFRTKPNAKNLRQYEHTLQEKSWFQQHLRPEVRRWLHASFGDTGDKAVAGLEGWLFYRPDVRYLIEPNRLETDQSHGWWVQPPKESTQRDSVVRAIIEYHRQLKERGIELLVVPIPGKPAVYPEKLTRRIHPSPARLESPTLELLSTLNRNGVATVDLFAAFAQYRKSSIASTNSSNDLYLAQDTHWTPQGARLAAQIVAGRLRQLGWAPATIKDYSITRTHVQRLGDVLELTHVPNLGPDSLLQEVECDQVLDPDLGLLVPTSSDRPGTYKTPGQAASILVLGDSFSRIYQYPEPQSLGRISKPPPLKAPPMSMKRLLPGSAGFISLLTAHLKAPVDAIVSDGGASTDVRRKLSTYPEMLEGKKVVIWEFVERDLALGRDAWEDVPLPRKLN